MIGEEVRQHRGIKQISFAAIALLLSLTVVALYQRSQAEAQRTIGRPAPPNPAMNSRRRIFDPSRWISEPYHNYGCRERWFALVPMFAALRKSASGPCATPPSWACRGPVIGELRPLLASPAPRAPLIPAQRGG